MKQIFIACEDALSEAVCRRIIETYAPIFIISDIVFMKNGFGYLKSNISKWQEISKQIPVFLLTDLDKRSEPEACAIELMHEWKVIPKENDFLFRVAVKTVESWLLADDETLRKFLKINDKSHWGDVERLSNPKDFLIQKAKSSPREIRDDIVPREGASIGIGYNEKLSDYINKLWNPEVARKKSDSLNRAIKNLERMNLKY